MTTSSMHTTIKNNFPDLYQGKPLRKHDRNFAEPLRKHTDAWQVSLLS